MLENKTIIQESDNHIPRFAGNVLYVDGSVSVSSDGKTPATPFKTIGEAISALSVGDAITIKAGTYTETGLNLNVDACEIWFEIGVIIAPATGTCFTISGDYCKTQGMHTITGVSGEIGKLISGDSCYCEYGTISGGGTGLKVTGSNFTGFKYACGNQTAVGFDLQGDKCRIDQGTTVGLGASYGYKINTGADIGVLRNCTSVGHETSGFYIDTLSADWTILGCSSGAGDGKWRDIDDNSIWSNFQYAKTKHKEITLNNTHEYNLFKITGAIEITEIFGHVTTILVGANTDVFLQLFSSASNSEITLDSGTSLGTAVVGTVVMKTEDPGKKITFFDGAGVGVDKGTDPKKKAVILNADPLNDTFIRWSCIGDNDTSGVIHFHVTWRPLTDNGFLEVA